MSSTSSSSTLNLLPTPFLPAITSLPTLSDAALTSTLDLLFEPSADLHTLALPTMRVMSFISYSDLIATLRDELLVVANAVQEGEAKKPLLRILAAHPRLGEKRIESAMSKAEQANLRGERTGKGGDNEEVSAELTRLNREYEERFPGLRYVVFVNGRGREAIMLDMKRRIERGDWKAEERAAIEAMCAIATDRAAKLQAAVPAAAATTPSS